MGQLVKYLSRGGMRVSVVTGRPGDLPRLSDIGTAADVRYAPNADLNAFPQVFLGRRSVVQHGYELSRLGRFRGLGVAYKQLVHFPDAQVGWSIPAARIAGRLDRPDVVLSSSPPASAHLAAAMFAIPRSIPWVAEYRSPWTDSLYFRRWWPARSVEVAMERWVGRRATVVTAISEYLSAVVSRRLGRSVQHIPNGFDPDDYRDTVAPEPGLIVHLGSVYAPYRTQILIDALQSLRRPPRVVFLGRNLANLREQLQMSRAGALIGTPGPTRHSEAITYIRRAEANILFVTERPGSSQYTDVPQKLFEYLAAGRPIIAIGPTTSETADLARRSGLTTFAETPAEVARCLERVPSATADPAVISEYSYDRIADRFTDVFRASG